MNNRPNSRGWYEEMTQDHAPAKVMAHQGQFTMEYIIEGETLEIVTAEAEKLAQNYYGYGCMMGSPRLKTKDNGSKVWQVTGHRGLRC